MKSAIKKGSSSKPAVYNELPYSRSSYDDFYKKMLSQLHQVSVSAHGKTLFPLTDYNLSAKDDFGTALIRAWALVADILSFYQDRNAAEGFLNTAVEDFSVRQLLDLLGYDAFPGEAAQAYLSFTLAKGKGVPKSVTIAKSPKTVVMSVPVKGESPVVFETIETISAKHRWNSMPAYIETNILEQKIVNGSTMIFIEGTNTGLKPGGNILIQKKGDLAKGYFRKIKSVTVEKTKGYTAVFWKLGLDLIECNELMNNFEVFTFKDECKLFGYNSQPWGSQLDTVKQEYGTVKGGVYRYDEKKEVFRNINFWHSINANLPSSANILTTTEAGSIFAGTSQGVFRLLSSSGSWELVGSTLPRSPVYALYSCNEGVFTGTVNGGVYKSSDDGVTWSAFPRYFQSQVTSQKKGWVYDVLHFLLTIITLNQLAKDSKVKRFKKNKVKPPTKQMISGVALSLTSITKHRDDLYTYMGTESGVFCLKEGDSYWQPMNEGLPGFNYKTGLAVIEVSSFTKDNELIYAGTNKGLFYGRKERAKTIWKQYPNTENLSVSSLMEPSINGGEFLMGTDQGLWLVGFDVGGSGKVQLLADVKVTSIDFQKLENKSVILVGTETGIFRSSNGGVTWLEVESGVDSGVNKQLIERVRVDSLFVAGLDELAVGDLVPSLFREVVVQGGVAWSRGAFILDASGNGDWLIEDEEQLYPVYLDQDQLVIYQIVDITNPYITSLAISQDGSYIAASPLIGFVEENWPNYKLEHSEVDLSKVTEVSTKEIFVLSQDTPIAVSQAYEVESITNTQRADFGLNTRISRISTTNDGQLGLFNLVDALAYVNPTKLTPFVKSKEELTILNGDEISLSGKYDDLKHGRSIAVTGQASSIVIPLMGGVYSQSSSKETSDALFQKSISALVADESNTIFAGTSEGVVFCKVNAACPWTYFSSYFVEGKSYKIMDLAVSDSVLYAGTSQGVYQTDVAKSQWEGINDGLPSNTEVRSIFIDVERIYIATNHGVFFLEVGSTHWSSLISNSSNIPHDLRAITVSHGIVVSGGVEGLFVYSEKSDWQAVDSELIVNDLVVGKAGEVYVGTQGKSVWVYDKTGVKPLHEGGNDKSLDVSALAIDENSNDLVLYVGTQGEGVFRCEFNRDTWILSSFSIRSSNRVLSLLVYSERQDGLLVGTESSVDLKSSEKEIVLKQTELFQIKGILSNEMDQGWLPDSLKTAFTKSGIKLTDSAVIQCLAVEDCWLIRQLDQVYVVTICESLFNFKYELKKKLSMEDPYACMMFIKSIFTKNGIKLSENARIKSGDQRIILHDRGKEYQLVQESQQASVMLYITERSSQYNVVETKLLEVVSQRGNSNNTEFWEVRDAAEGAGKLASRPRDYYWQNAASWNKKRSDIIRINTVEASSVKGDIVTICKLNRKLMYAYDASTVTVNGNVALATQGESSAPEILGSGDASKSFQKFTLKKPPLTYLKSLGKSGVVSTLEVGINSGPYSSQIQSTKDNAARVLWKESANLFLQSPRDRVYKVQNRDGGVVDLLFGDGVHGARLPTGQENVVATYRSGLGTEGNVAAGQLMLLRKAVTGVRSVTNLLPAIGGKDPEVLTESREKAGETVQAINRIVSLSDYAHFVQAYEEVKKANVTTLESDSEEIILVTVVYRELKDTGSHAMLHTQLIREISQNRVGGQPFQLLNYEKRMFEMEASITVNSDAHMVDVIGEVKAKLINDFSLSKRRLNQPVSAGELVTCMCSVVGVASVQLMSNFIKGQVKQYNIELKAQGARSHCDTYIGAELLVIDAENGITLTSTYETHG